MLSQTNGVPVLVKDVAKVYVGYVPRLGSAGATIKSDVVEGDRRHEPHPAHQRRRGAHRSRGRTNQHATDQPAGRREARAVLRSHHPGRGHHDTVLHNLVFGCLLVFFIQWIFLGDLRSAIIVGVNIPFALFFSVIILVLLGRGCKPPVGRCRRFRHYRRLSGDPGRERLSQFAGATRHSGELLLQSLAEQTVGYRPDGVA